MKKLTRMLSLKLTQMLKMMKKDFASVRHLKPMASRDDSAELFVLAMGFRGGKG